LVLKIRALLCKNGSLDPQHEAWDIQQMRLFPSKKESGFYKEVLASDKKPLEAKLQSWVQKTAFGLYKEGFKLCTFKMMVWPLW